MQKSTGQRSFAVYEPTVWKSVPYQSARRDNRKITDHVQAEVKDMHLWTVSVSNTRTPEAMRLFAPSTNVGRYLLTSAHSVCHRSSRPQRRPQSTLS